MIELNVYIVNKDEQLNGSACLIENLIDNTIRLEITKDLFIGETKALINKAVNLLKQRYEKIKVNINWGDVEEDN